MRTYDVHETTTALLQRVSEPVAKQWMPLPKKYAIYAAPRADNGQYRRCEEKPLFYNEFRSLEAMQRYWDRKIVPATTTKFGLAYELSMVEVDRVMWDFFGAPRYAEKPVLPAKAPAGANVYSC